MAQGEEEAREARDESEPEGPCEAEDRERAREGHDADDVAHIARPNRWAWGGELWPPEFPLDPSAW